MRAKFYFFYLKKLKIHNYKHIIFLIIDSNAFVCYKECLLRCSLQRKINYKKMNQGQKGSFVIVIEREINLNQGTKGKFIIIIERFYLAFIIERVNCRNYMIC